MENVLIFLPFLLSCSKSYNFNLDDSRKRRIDKFKCAICVQLLFNEPSFPSILSVSQHSASLHIDESGHFLSGLFLTASSAAVLYTRSSLNANLLVAIFN